MLCVFLVAAHYGVASEKVQFTLASADVLSKRLCAGGFQDFHKYTTIVDDLAGQQKKPFGVAVSVDISICFYNDLAAKNKVAKMSEGCRSQLLKIILQDYPDALKVLESKKVYREKEPCELGK